MLGLNFTEKKSQCVMLDIHILVEPLPYEIDLSVSIFLGFFGPGAHPTVEIFAGSNF